MKDYLLAMDPVYLLVSKFYKIFLYLLKILILYYKKVF